MREKRVSKINYRLRYQKKSNSAGPSRRDSFNKDIITDESTESYS